MSYTQRIYLDNFASTPTLPEVGEAMLPFLTGLAGNASSAHQEGRRERRALEDSREMLAGLLNAQPEEVIFTSGATEANNLAMFGFAPEPSEHLIASPIEHPCVTEPIQRLTERGICVSLLPVDETGVVQVDALESLLEPETRLISVMLVNHETGAIQPIAQIQKMIAEWEMQKRAARFTSFMEQRCHFHCDAVQAVGKIPVRFHELGVTSLSISAHKFHGPKGIGALLVKKGMRLKPMLWGGHQQQGNRPGTEPVASIVGMVKALELAEAQREQRWNHVLQLRERFLAGLRANLGEVIINGPETGTEAGAGLPHVMNVSFPGLQADALLMSLDLAGVACSTGSACSSGSLLPSPVLKAMNVSPERLTSALRFSLSALLSESDIDHAVDRIVQVVQRLSRVES